jgi:hypothetical protein
MSQQDELRNLAAAYPIQAGALYTTFTDLMLCELKLAAGVAQCTNLPDLFCTAQQWYSLRLLDLKAAGWAVILGQKTIEVSRKCRRAR